MRQLRIQIRGYSNSAWALKSLLSLCPEQFVSVRFRVPGLTNAYGYVAMSTREKLQYAKRLETWRET